MFVKSEFLIEIFYNIQNISTFSMKKFLKIVRTIKMEMFPKNSNKIFNEKVPKKKFVL